MKNMIDQKEHMFYILHVLPQKKRNKINLIIFFSFKKNKKVFLYINYCKIKGRETHVAWVMNAMWIFNNILILLSATSRIFIY